MEEDRLTCFLSVDRFCGPDCISYKVIPDGNVQLDTSQQRCVLLSSVERTGRSLNIIASVLHEQNNRMRKAQEDAQRSASHVQQGTTPVGVTSR